MPMVTLVSGAGGDELIHCSLLGSMDALPPWSQPSRAKQVLIHTKQLYTASDFRLHVFRLRVRAVLTELVFVYNCQWR